MFISQEHAERIARGVTADRPRPMESIVNFLQYNKFGNVIVGAGLGEISENLGLNGDQSRIVSLLGMAYAGDGIGHARNLFKGFGDRSPSGGMSERKFERALARDHINQLEAERGESLSFAERRQIRQYYRDGGRPPEQQEVHGNDVGLNKPQLQQTIQGGDSGSYTQSAPQRNQDGSYTAYRGRVTPDVGDSEMIREARFPRIRNFINSAAGEYTINAVSAGIGAKVMDDNPVLGAMLGAVGGTAVNNRFGRHSVDFSEQGNNAIDRLAGAFNRAGGHSILSQPTHGAYTADMNSATRVFMYNNAHGVDQNIAMMAAQSAALNSTFRPM